MRCLTGKFFVIQRSLFQDWPPDRSDFTRICSRRQRSCCCDLVCYLFLKLSKIEITENLRFLTRTSPRRCLLLAVVVVLPVPRPLWLESEPKSRMTRASMSGVMVMASSGHR